MFRLDDLPVDFVSQNASWIAAALCLTHCRWLYACLDMAGAECSSLLFVRASLRQLGFVVLLCRARAGQSDLAYRRSGNHRLCVVYSGIWTLARCTEAVPRCMSVIACLQQLKSGVLYSVLLTSQRPVGLSNAC